MDNLVANPKCKSCKTYWIPNEDDILTSGLVAKTCKRCREHQKEVRRKKNEMNEKRDYQQGKIYTIKSLTSDDVYVGSTIQPLHRRMYGHRCDWKNNIVLGKHKEIVKDITEWEIELYELFPCNSKTELEIREGQVIKKFSTLNNQIAGRTRKEYLIENADKIKETRKEYCIKNTDKIKEYNIENADKIKEIKKEYRIKNADKIKEYRIENVDKRKKYRIENTDKLKEQNKIYRIKNADKIKENLIKNVDKIKEYKKEYYIKNADKRKKYRIENTDKIPKELQSKKEETI